MTDVDHLDRTLSGEKRPQHESNGSVNASTASALRNTSAVPDLRPQDMSSVTSAPGTPPRATPRASPLVSPIASPRAYTNNSPRHSTTQPRANWYGHSPDRPKGPGVATVAHSQDHGEAKWLPSVTGASSTLFGLFRRQPSVENLSMFGSRASINDSIFGGLDNMAAPADLASPTDAKAASAKVAAAIEAAKVFRDSLEAMSTAAANFGAALDECSRSKGADKSSSSLQAAGGLHLLVSNHIHILRSSFEDKFIAPATRGLESFRTSLTAKENEFRTQLRSRNETLRRAEQASQRQSRRRNRKLAEYRSTLLDITSQIDDINSLKFEFLGDMYGLSSELSEQLVRQLSSVVTAEIEIFESIARKGWSGGGLDGLLAGAPDPFAAEPGNGDSDDEEDTSALPDTLELGDESPANLFSVLPQTSILPREQPDEPGDLTISTTRSDDDL